MGDYPPIRSCDDAIAAGEKRYFTGKPCKNGHVGDRHTSSRQCITCQQIYRRRDRDRINARFRRYQPLWRARNRDKVRATKARMMAKPEFKLVHLLRIRAYNTLKKAGLTKTTRHSKLFGAPVKAVRAYLEARFKPGMSWENWGFGADKWHIDHILPISSFDLAVPGEMERAFHYTNLQPLWQHENLSKGSKVTAQ